MICEKCGADEKLYIVDSRHCGEGVRRRRKCGACGHHFTTHELSVERMGSLEADGNKWRRIRRYLARLEAAGGRGE